MSSARTADTETAVRIAILTDAARAGDAHAQFELGERYARGDDVEQDGREAVLWWIKAARQAHPDAAARLAEAMENGEHLPREPVQAARFRRRAAEWGNAEAQWQLARTTEPASEALQWLRRAAGSGHPEATYTLARHYEEGQLVDRDTVRALSLYQRAAVAGHASAANTLGVLLAEGAGGMPDLPAAYFWFDVAARHGLAVAERNRSAVAERLARRERRRIRRRVDGFLKGEADPPDV